MAANKKAGEISVPSRTALYDLHRELGGKMVPFAGYELPVQYPGGILAEHTHTRESAGLFDVSHMGQIRITPSSADDIDSAVAALEKLVPGDIARLKPGQMRYTFFTDDNGGILDDLMVTRLPESLLLVVNADVKAQDLEHLNAHFSGGFTVEMLSDRAMLALQGPSSAAVLDMLAPGVSALGFLGAGKFSISDIDCEISRSGYTGEDGFEISLQNKDADRLARLLLGLDGVAPIGLGARDTLRLEAGLCLYGHDIDSTTTPVQAGLAWAIGKRRKIDGGFPGAEKILQQISDGPERLRVGILLEGRVAAREGAVIVDPLTDRQIGHVTSGSFGPTVGAPVAMGYVEHKYSEDGINVGLIVRDKVLPGKIVAMPFVPRHKVAAGQ